MILDVQNPWLFTKNLSELARIKRLFKNIHKISIFLQTRDGWLEELSVRKKKKY